MLIHAPPAMQEVWDNCLVWGLGVGGGMFKCSKVVAYANSHSVELYELPSWERDVDRRGGGGGGQGVCVDITLQIRVLSQGMWIHLCSYFLFLSLPPPLLSFFFLLRFTIIHWALHVLERQVVRQKHSFTYQNKLRHTMTKAFHWLSLVWLVQLQKLHTQTVEHQTNDHRMQCKKMVSEP